MPLYWNLDDVREHKTTCFDGTGNMRPTTERLIAATMAVGMPTITARNAAEFYTRLNVVERLLSFGPTTTTTFDEVRTHIGLRTNAPKLTDAAFWKRTRERFERQALADTTRVQAETTDLNPRHGAAEVA